MPFLSKCKGTSLFFVTTNGRIGAHLEIKNAHDEAAASTFGITSDVLCWRFDNTLWNFRNIVWTTTKNISRIMSIFDRTASKTVSFMVFNPYVLYWTSQWSSSSVRTYRPSHSNSPPFLRLRSINVTADMVMLMRFV